MFQLPWQPIEVSNLAKIYIYNIYICNVGDFSRRKKTYFHFSHYKPMETISCHSDESTSVMLIKNITFVEANFMNIS